MRRAWLQGSHSPLFPGKLLKHRCGLSARLPPGFCGPDP